VEAEESRAVLREKVDKLEKMEKHIKSVIQQALAKDKQLSMLQRAVAEAGVKVYIYIYIYVHLYIYMCIYTHIPVYAYTLFTHIIYTHIHIHTYTHTHTHIQVTEIETQAMHDAVAWAKQKEELQQKLEQEELKVNRLMTANSKDAMIGKSADSAVTFAHIYIYIHTRTCTRTQIQVDASAAKTDKGADSAVNLHMHM